MTCHKTQEFLARRGIRAKTVVNARKQRFGADEVLHLTRDLSEVIATKGKTIVRFRLATDKPSRDDLLAVLLGPSGTLRAPALRTGRKLLVGFDPTVYRDILG